MRESEPTLVHSLRQAAQEDAEATAFVFVTPFGESRITYAELFAEAEAHAARLLALGLERGDRVGLLLSEPRHFVGAFLGVMRAGLVAVPMGPPLAVVELESWLDGAARILTKARARAVLFDESSAERVQSLRERAPGVELFLGAESVHSDGAREDLGRLPPLTAPDEAELALLQFTSGSTDSPKGVCITHRALLANCDAIMDHVLQVRRGKEVAVGWLPLHHDMGLMALFVGPIRSRCLSVLMRPLDFAKKPARWLTTVSKHAGTVTFAPNFAYDVVTQRPPAMDQLDLSSLRVLGCGAEPIRAQTLRAFVERFAPVGLRAEAVMPCYGMAESVVGVAMTRLEDPIETEVVDRVSLAQGYAASPTNDVPGVGGAPEHADEDAPERNVEVVCCGRALPGHQLETIDADGNALPDRLVGEFRVRGPSIAAGYFEDPDASRARFTPQGLRTGDLGYMVDGKAFVTGRIKELVIIGGCNYAPTDIESVVEQVPGVRAASCVAFSVPNERGGERLIVVVEARMREYREAHEPLILAVRLHVQKRLGLVVADAAVLPPASLPRTSSGKLRRGEVRERYRAGTAL